MQTLLQRLRKAYSPLSFGKSTWDAIAGIRYALRHDSSYQRVATAEVALAAAIAWFHSALSAREIHDLVLAGLLLLITESFNTSIEQANEGISQERKECIKHSKDCAASPTFIATWYGIYVCESVIYAHL